MDCLVTLGVKSSIAMSSLFPNCFLYMTGWYKGLQPRKNKWYTQNGHQQNLFCQAEGQRKQWPKKIIILAILLLFSQPSVENLHLMVSIGVSRELNLHCPRGRNRWSNSLTKTVSAKLNSELSFYFQMTLNKAVGAGLVSTLLFPTPSVSGKLNFHTHWAAVRLNEVVRVRTGRYWSALPTLSLSVQCWAQPLPSSNIKDTQNESIFWSSPPPVLAGPT